MPTTGFDLTEPPKSKGFLVTPFGAGEPAPKPRRSCGIRAVVQNIHFFLTYYSSQKVIATYCAYNLLFAIGSFIFCIFFGSITDVSDKFFNLPWIHCALILPSFFCSIVGLYGAIKRNSWSTRWFFMTFPFCIFASTVFSYTVWKVKCDCSNFKQCGAIKDFCSWYGKDFVNPHPAPPNIEKFQTVHSLPFHDVPHSASSLVDVGQGGADNTTSRIRNRSSHTRATAISAESLADQTIARLGRNQTRTQASALTATVGRRGYGLMRARQELQRQQLSRQMKICNSGTSEQISLLSRNEQAQGPNLKEAPQAEDIVHEDMAQEITKEHEEDKMHKPYKSQEVIYDDDPSTEDDYHRTEDKIENVAIREIAHNAEYAEDGAVAVGAAATLQDDAANESVRRLARLWKRKTNSALRPVRDFFRTKNSELLTYHADPDASKKVKCRTVLVDHSPHLWEQVRACRIALKNNKTHKYLALCPEVVDQALIQCVIDSTCGAVKVHLENAVDAEGAAEKDLWNVTTCNMPQALFIEPADKPAIGHEEEGTAQEPYTEYFERDWDKKYEETLNWTKHVAQKSAAHDIHEQKKMSTHDWIEHMIERRRNTCTCDPSGKSCHVAKDKSKVTKTRFWCTVTKESEAVCKEQAHPKIRLHKKEDGNFWTEDLCTKDLEDQQESTAQSTAKCECQPSLGVRVTGYEKEKLQSVIAADAEFNGYEDVTIGYGSCKKWYKDDKHPWCVVGFDTACSDRELLTISDKGLHKGLVGVRVWKSSLPCQEASFLQELSSAMQFCSATQLAWVILDWPRLLLALPLLFMTYQFLVNRCADCSIKYKTSFWQIKDEDDSDVSDWSSIRSLSPDPTLVSDSETPVDKEKKSKAQSSKTKKSDPAKKKDKKKKKSEEGSSWDIDDEEVKEDKKKKKSDEGGSWDIDDEDQ